MDDNKKSTTIWLRPSVISRMDGWLQITVKAAANS